MWYDNRYAMPVYYYGPTYTHTLSLSLSKRTNCYPRFIVYTRMHAHTCTHLRLCLPRLHPYACTGTVRTSTVHFISHNGNMQGTTCGKHYSSALSDMRTWTTKGCAYQAKGVVFATGAVKVRDFGRRERPHLIFDNYRDGGGGGGGGGGSDDPGSGAWVQRPVAFTTAVTAIATECVGKPRCLYRYPDASYTLLQAVNTTADQLDI